MRLVLENNLIIRLSESSVNETAKKAVAISKVSAKKPNTRAIRAVKIVLSCDCADNTEVRIGLGTLSAIAPVRIGLRKLSITKNNGKGH